METGLQKLNHQQKAVQWGERIASCRSSGLTVRQWCSENGISAGSYYKWQRRLYQVEGYRPPDDRGHGSTTAGKPL